MLKKMMLATVATAVILAPAAMARNDRDGGFQTNRTFALAGDLLDATRQLRADAGRSQRGRHGESSELLVALHRLEDQAQRFQVDVARDVRSRQLEIRFDGLVTAFDRVDRRMQTVHSGRLQHDFDQVERAMGSLARNVSVAHGPRDRRNDEGPRGAIVLGNSRGDTRFQVRIRF